jgi:hypothetical protein
MCDENNWMGNHICFHCTKPCIYPAHLPSFNECNPWWRNSQIYATPDQYLNVFKDVIYEARRLKGRIIYATFNVRPPPPEVLRKRAENIKGMPATIAANFDKSQDRKNASLRKHGASDHPDVWDRINRHEPYRRSMANYLINVDCYYNPAQYVLSKYCRHALQIARQMKEIEEAAPLGHVQLQQYDDA